MNITLASEAKADEVVVHIRPVCTVATSVPKEQGGDMY